MASSHRGLIPGFTRKYHRSFAPGGKQVLRACGAQDDSARSLREGRGRNPHFYLRHAVRVILSERAERARAKDLLEDAQRAMAGTAGGGPSDRLMTEESEGDDTGSLSRSELDEAAEL